MLAPADEALVLGLGEAAAQAFATLHRPMHFEVTGQEGARVQGAGAIQVIGRFDRVVFTAPQAREDPCAAMRRPPAAASGANPGLR